MTRVERSALVPFAAPRMYGLVVDVPTYAQRFAWCEQATLLESSDTVQVARLGVKVGGMRTAFTTRNTLVAGERIDMALEEGPFQRLSGVWSFHALSDSASRVRSEESRVGKECVGTCRSRWSPYYEKKH